MLDSIHGYYPQPLLDEYNDSFPVEQELTSNIFSKYSVQRYGKGWHAKLAPVSPVWGAPTLLLSDLFDPWQLCFWYHTSGVFTSWLVVALHCFPASWHRSRAAGRVYRDNEGTEQCPQHPNFNREVQMYFCVFLHVCCVSILQTQPSMSCARHTDFIFAASALKSFSTHIIAPEHSQSQSI